MKKNRIVIIPALVVLLFSFLIPLLDAGRAVAETTTEIPIHDLRVNDKKQGLGTEVKAGEFFEVSFKVEEQLVVKIAKAPDFQLEPIMIETSMKDQQQAKTAIYQDDKDYVIPVTKGQQVFFTYRRLTAEPAVLVVKGHHYSEEEPASYQESAAFEKLLFQTNQLITEETATSSSTETSSTSESAENTDLSTTTEPMIETQAVESTTSESAEVSSTQATATSEEQTHESQETHESGDWSKATEALAPSQASSNLAMIPKAKVLASDVTGKLSFVKEEVVPNGENHLNYQTDVAGAGIKMAMTLIQLPTESVGDTGQIKQIYYQWSTANGENPNRKVYYSMEDFAKGPAYFYNKAASSESIPADWYPWDINEPVGVNPRTMIILSMGSLLTADEPAIDFTLTLDHGVSGYHFQSRGAILEWNETDPITPILHDIPVASFVIAGFTIAGQVMTDTTDSAAMAGLPVAGRQVNLEMLTDTQDWTPVLTHETQPQPKTTQTDDTGKYSFSGLSPGTYRVTVANSENLLAAKGEATTDRANVDNKAQGIAGQQLISRPIIFPEADLIEANIGTPVLNYQNMNLKFYKENGSLSIQLMDSDTGGNLNGGEFKLVDSNGDLVTTDINGQAYPLLITEGGQPLVLSKLPLGEYSLVESKAPSGYELAKETFKLTLTAQQKDVTVKIANQRQEELPFTGNNGVKPEQILLLALLSLALSLSSILLKRFKFDWGKWLLILLVSGGALAFATRPASAAEAYGEESVPQNERLETPELRLTIHKYGYTGEYRSKVTTGMSDAEIQRVLGSDPQLKPLAGIRYRITEIQRSSAGPYDPKNPATYQILPDGFSITIETDQAGVAAVGSEEGLQAGDYLITELPNQQVEIPMAAKITSLPRTDDLGEQLLYDVHMYPKEPVTEQTTPSTTEPSTTPATSTSTTPTTTPSSDSRPPLTSQPLDPPLVKVVPDTGTIGQLINKVAGMIPQTNDIQRAGISIIGLLLLLLAFWLLVWRRRKDEEDEEQPRK